MSSTSFEIRVETVVHKHWETDSWIADWIVVRVLDGREGTVIDHQTETFGPLWEPDQVYRMVEQLGRNLAEVNRATLAAVQGPYSIGAPVK